MATDEQVLKALDELEKLTNDNMQATAIPGIAIAVVHKDMPVYLKGFGVLEAGKAEQVDADTVFQLASVSKPVSSTVVAALVSDGVVQWDDPIHKYDPSFEMYDPYVTHAITIRDMLSHRSGLPDHAGDLLEDIGYDRTAILQRLRYIPLEDRFRAQYAYTNFGFTEGAMAVATAVGKAWEEVCDERLYKPLGMTATSSRFANFLARPNRAHNHVRVDGKWVAKEQRAPDAQSPAGGVSSSVRDMVQWLRLHLGSGKVDGKQIISAEALAETYRPHMTANPAKNPAIDRTGFYGLGWNVSYDDGGRVKLGHSGGFELGAATNVTLIPAEQLGIVVLTNSAPIGLPETLAQSFIEWATVGKITRPWATLYKQGFAAMDEEGHSQTDYANGVPTAAPALSSSAYIGNYRNDFFGEIEIAPSGDGLVMRLGPKPMEFPLTKYSHDTFYYGTPGENAVGLSGVTFTLGPDGKASSVYIENLDAYGLGTFKRAEK